VIQGDGSQPWQRSAVYTFGYNPALFARRVHDILTVVRFVGDSPSLVGLGTVAGPLVAAARAQVGGSLTAAVDTGGFRFESLERFDDPMFLPGAVKYGDLPALLALGAAGRLWLAGEGKAPPEVVTRAYGGRVQDLAVSTRSDARAAVGWLIREHEG